MGGTTGRGDWPPLPVDPSTVQCVDAATVWAGWKLCHATADKGLGASDALFDECHALYEDNDCYRPDACLADAVNHCRSSHVVCSPSPPPPSPPPPQPPSAPSAPCVDLSDTDFDIGKAACHTAFQEAQDECQRLFELPKTDEGKLTKKEKKECKKDTVAAGLVCSNALFCPPLGTKS